MRASIGNYIVINLKIYVISLINLKIVTAYYQAGVG